MHSPTNTALLCFIRCVPILLTGTCTCIFQLNDLFCTTIRENASINIHPQSKYPTYTLKVKVMPYIHPHELNRPKNVKKILNRKFE